MQARQWVWAVAGVVGGVWLGARELRRWRARQNSPLIGPHEQGTALVTGASSGIGQVYAETLAAMGYDVILVARRKERLINLATRLTETAGIHAQVVVADLSTAEGVERVEYVIRETEDLNVLINNAGFGLAGHFAETAVSAQEDMIRVHVMATVRLTRAALPVMIAQHRGAIVNVASLMAFYPLSGSVTYGATKSYLRAFTEALHQELWGTGVRAQALCPGFTRTEILASGGRPGLTLPGFLWMTSEQVVRRSLRDLRNDRVVSVPGFGYRMLALASRFIPRRLFYLVGHWVDRWIDT